MGRIVAWDELSPFGIWDELSLGTNRRLGRIVALRTRSWSSDKMLAFQPRGFVFEPVRMR